MTSAAWKRRSLTLCEATTPSDPLNRNPMKPTIRVENLGKKYRIGPREGAYATLRESLTRMARASFDRLRHGSRVGGARVNGKPRNDRFWALKHVDFEVKPGEVVGIIGRNGAGKSTLLKVLSRITEPTEGRVDLYGRVGSLLEVGTGFHPELTGRENIFLSGAILGMRRSEISRKFDKIVNFAEVELFLDTPVKHYSSGMYVRLAFAVAAHLETEILIVDEVLAVGDTKFQNKCIGKMENISRKSGRTVLFVSHNLSAVEKLCTKAFLMESGVLALRGTTTEVIASYLNSELVSFARFESGPLTQVSFKQIGTEVELQVTYDVAHPVKMACLGFVITDQMGRPVCGSNPRFEQIGGFGNSTRRGQIRTMINEPKLRDGIYHISVWFGDGDKDFSEYRDVCSLSVSKMRDTESTSITAVGAVIPACTWELFNYE